ncbi:hypothetical protein BT69DRAFT_1315477 [Atractiella rhizophila]|nr:hypothetical protein BT69DRAFT_1325875 [Atractiella rhizophila]KAH8929703.1 hypothetical protein BT69DRAFT_1315477 [Atractiella rhizophila]
MFDSERDEIEQHKQNFINLFRNQSYKAPSTSSQPIPSQLQPLPKSMKGRVNLTANFLATIQQGPGAGAEEAVMKEINYLFRFEALAWDSDLLAFWKYSQHTTLKTLHIWLEISWLFQGVLWQLSGSFLELAIPLVYDIVAWIQKYK